MSFVSVCKNIIAQNNKRGWIDPLPAIRVSRTKSGKATEYASAIGITDANGNIVATLLATADGKPVIKCGAKVGLVTNYPVVVLK